jgi:3-methyladenine DNA glycosylase AlkC
MGLFAKELAVGTQANECFDIYQRSQPVETRAKRLADECARSRMVPTHTFMNLLEYLFAFLCADTLHECA